jgi:hypothetical protein
MILDARQGLALEIDGWHHVSSQQQTGKLGSFVALVRTLMSSEPGGFSVFGKVFPAEGHGGLSTFGDSLSGEMFFAGEAEGIS